MSDGSAGQFWDDTAYVVVYRYRYWDPARQAMVVSDTRATLDAIRAGLGIPMTESGRKVPRTAVDPYGRCRIEMSDEAEG
jgi:hypothetical protein